MEGDSGQVDYGLGRLGLVLCCFWSAYKSQLSRIYLLSNDNTVYRNFFRVGPLPLAMFTATHLRAWHVHFSCHL